MTNCNEIYSLREATNSNISNAFYRSSKLGTKFHCMSCELTTSPPGLNHRNWFPYKNVDRKPLNQVRNVAGGGRLWLIMKFQNYWQSLKEAVCYLLNSRYFNSSIPRHAKLVLFYIEQPQNKDWFHFDLCLWSGFWFIMALDHCYF